MHQSKETNRRISGKDKKRPRFIEDDWGLLEDIFEQRQHKLRKRTRRHPSHGPLRTDYEAD